jgi:oxygen-independent coproporphyrinogen-3 oxidase
MTDPGGAGRIGGDNVVATGELPFEYMLNALRLIVGVPLGDFPARSGLAPETIAPALAAAGCSTIHGVCAPAPTASVS